MAAAVAICDSFTGFHTIFEACMFVSADATYPTACVPAWPERPGYLRMGYTIKMS